MSDVYKRFEDFFNGVGRERLDGLDVSYFSKMTEDEKRKAFDKLKENYWDSTEAIKGLYLINEDKALVLFVEYFTNIADNQLFEYEVDRRDRMLAEILMLSYLYTASKDFNYILKILGYYNDQDEEVRDSALYYTPNIVNKEIIDAVSKLILEEDNKEVLASAAIFFLELHGIDIDWNGDLSSIRALYMPLKNDDKEKRMEAVTKISDDYPIIDQV